MLNIGIGSAKPIPIYHSVSNLNKRGQFWVNGRVWWPPSISLLTAEGDGGGEPGMMMMIDV